MTKSTLKAEAIRLRLEENLSLNEIHERTGAAKGSLSIWLRPHPRSEDLRFQRGKESPRRYKKGEPSKLYAMTEGRELTNHEKGCIAEAAVEMRLLIRGFKIYSSSYDGEHVDFIIETPDRRLLRLQIKWVSYPERGSPHLRLRHSISAYKLERYKPGSFDFLIGYDLYTDTAHIFAEAELEKNTNAICVGPESAEAWHKIKQAPIG